MPEQARIAVVIVCRNALPALRDTLDRLDALADARVLPIVVDGASDDGTGEWLDERRNRLFSARSEPDRGIYDAMNKGWRAAPDDAWVLYLGAGDHLLELPPDSELQDTAGQPRDIVIGECQVGEQPFRSRWTPEMDWRNTVHHQAQMVRKPVSPEPPFDDTLRVYADWDFNLRLKRRGLAAHTTPRLRAYAQPGGASWVHTLGEIRRVAARHGGSLMGWRAWLLNGASRWRRRWS